VPETPRSELDPADLAAAVERFSSFYIRLGDVSRLSFTTLSVLHTLSERSPRRLGDLTSTEQVTQPAVTQIVTRLEQDGLVERRPDPSDGRAVLVHITPAGDAVMATRRANRMARIAPLLAQLTGPQRAALAAALPVLHRIAELGEDAAGPPKTLGELT
jgi:DNA-binding MarR family transcriptional regulator